MGYRAHKNEIDLGMVIKLFVQKYHLLQLFDRILQGCDLKEKIFSYLQYVFIWDELCKEIINFV